MGQVGEGRRWVGNTPTLGRPGGWIGATCQIPSCPLRLFLTPGAEVPSPAGCPEGPREVLAAAAAAPSGEPPGHPASAAIGQPAQERGSLRAGPCHPGRPRSVALHSPPLPTPHILSLSLWLPDALCVLDIPETSCSLPRLPFLTSRVPAQTLLFCPCGIWTRGGSARVWPTRVCLPSLQTLYPQTLCSHSTGHG